MGVAPNCAGVVRLNCINVVKIVYVCKVIFRVFVGVKFVLWSYISKT